MSNVTSRPGRFEQASHGLPDMQNTRDERDIAIDKVGVRGVKFPISVLDRVHGRQHTIGDFTLTVDLPSEFKGTHMSRFLEALNDHHGEISVNSIPDLLKKLAARLHAKCAHVEVSFPFFLEKAAPVTGKTGMMEYTCGFSAQANGCFDLEMIVEVPVATLCPCSKEISEYGAHNQRGHVTIRVRTNEHVWLEELIEIAEQSASCPLFPVLKRPDEKWVTEHAFDNPRFVEDVVREVAVRLAKDPRVDSYSIEVENFESIHSHNAYATLERTKS